MTNNFTKVMGADQLRQFTTDLGLSTSNLPSWSGREPGRKLDMEPDGVEQIQKIEELNLVIVDQATNRSNTMYRIGYDSMQRNRDMCLCERGREKEKERRHG